MFTRNKTDKPNISDHDRNASTDWEADILRMQRIHSKRGWTFAYTNLGVVILLIILILFLLPLKTTVPYVVTVDRTTGEVTVGQTFKDYANNTELNDKYWVKKFLTARETYNYRLLQASYDTVSLLSSDSIFKEYESQFIGDNAVDKKVGDRQTVTPTVLSISITNGNLATVRFETKTVDSRLGAEPKIQRYIALVKYEYKVQAAAKQSVLYDNPLGFTVTAYQVDQELVSQ